MEAAENITPTACGNVHRWLEAALQLTSEPANRAERIGNFLPRFQEQGQAAAMLLVVLVEKMTKSPVAAGC